MSLEREVAKVNEEREARSAKREAAKVRAGLGRSRGGSLEREVAGMQQALLLILWAYLFQCLGFEEHRVRCIPMAKSTRNYF